MNYLNLARLSLVLLILASLALGGPAIAAAQTTDGRLVVTVRDVNHEVVAGAKISALNVATQYELTSTTSEKGAGTLTPVPVGVYTVTVSAPGFATWRAEQVKVDVGREASLAVELVVGSVSDEATVYDEGESLVTTTTLDVTSTVTKKQLEDLPVLGRDVLAFIQLQAGVSIFNGRAGVTINGQRTSTAVISRDGIYVQDWLIRSNALTYSPNRTTISQVAEFTVTTQNAGVDLAGASAIRLVTPFGGNEVHGEIFEYHRNDVFGANAFFANATDNPRPQLIRNQFGFTLSGPVVIPHLYDGHDKLFLFGTYEGFRERTADTYTTTVLTPEARTGLFTYRRRDNERLDTINVLQASGVAPDPIAQMLLATAPLPNGNFAGDLVTTAGYTFNKSRPRDRDQVGGRLDYHITDRSRLEAIYQFTDEVGGRSDIDGSFTTLPVVHDVATTHFAVAAWTWNVTDSITNELRAGFNNQTLAFTNDQEELLPYFVVFPGITSPQVAYDPQARRTITSSLIDNASWVWGEHVTRFGVRADQIRLRNKVSYNVIPRLWLGAAPFSEVGSRLSYSDFPGGLVDVADVSRANTLLATLGGLITGGQREFSLRSKDDTEYQSTPKVHNHLIDQYAVYGADQWRVHPRLTLSLGLRWDYTTPLSESDDLGLMPATPGGAGLLDPDGKFDFIDGFYANPDRNNFAPNIGVAWDVFGDGTTSLRGGFSMAYVNDETVRSSQFLTDTNPGLATTVNSGSVFGGQLGDNAVTFIETYLQAPDVAVPISFVDYKAINAAAIVGSISPDVQTPHYKQWNVSVEREIGWDTAVSVRYVGNKGYDLLSSLNHNPIETVTNGWAADVARARSNGFLARERTGIFDPRYNPNIPGSQVLTIFPTLPYGGLLTNSAVTGFIATGEAYQLARLYVENRLEGDFPFKPNPNVYFAVLLDNQFTSDYHALQTEVRRRFSQGLTFQANYTWSKVLGYSNGIDQLRQDFPSDPNNFRQDRRRLHYDQTHNFKANAIYELPIGDGKWLDPASGWAEGFAGGWRIASIINWNTGAPLSIGSFRYTTSTVSEQAHTTLTHDQIVDLLGIYERDGQIYYIDPSVIGPNGAAAAPDGQEPFPGQVFFNPGPGEHGSLQASQFNGPTYFNWDASVIKRVRVTEKVDLELRGDMFNVLNKPIFFVNSQTISSTTFGRVNGQLNSPRVVQLAAKLTF